MADESNLINVEDDTPPPPAPPAAPAAPVAAAPPPPPAPDPPPDPDESDAVDIQGGKYVPLSALKTVRDENKGLREKARQADQLAQYVNETKPYVDFLKQNPDLLKPRQAAPAAPQAPVVDTRAQSFARNLDLYTQDASGQAVPDVAKAQTILGIIEQVADQVADKRVRPMAQQTAQERSARNYQWALTVKDPSGKQVAPDVINQIWRSMPVEYTENPQIAQVLVYTALGMDRMQQQRQPAAPANLPVVTEGVGGNPRTRPVLSVLEQNIARERGVDEKKWAGLTEGFNKGRTTVLEE